MSNALPDLHIPVAPDQDVPYDDPELGNVVAALFVNNVVAAQPADVVAPPNDVALPPTPPLNQVPHVLAKLNMLFWLSDSDSDA